MQHADVDMLDTFFRGMGLQVPMLREVRRVIRTMLAPATCAGCDKPCGNEKYCERCREEVDAPQAAPIHFVRPGLFDDAREWLGSFWNEWGWAVKKTVKTCAGFVSVFLLMAFCVIAVMQLFPNQ